MDDVAVSSYWRTIARVVVTFTACTAGVATMYAIFDVIYGMMTFEPEPLEFFLMLMCALVGACLSALLTFALAFTFIDVVRDSASRTTNILHYVVRKFAIALYRTCYTLCWTCTLS